MSNNRGIFDSFPSQPGTRPDSPFAVVHEPAADAPAVSSPFAAAPRQDSPFTVVDEAESAPAEFGRPVRLPEKRRADSPFQAAEPGEGFGFEASARPLPAGPFDAVAAPAPPFALEAAPASPFSAAPAPQAAAPASPFAVAEPPRPASPATQAAIAAFSTWQEPAAAASPFTAQPEPAPAPAAVPSAFAAAPPPAPPAPAPVAAPAPQPVTAAAAEEHSDSSSIRQLELRAIFGVDREMGGEEILQRSRALPGMRNIARVGPNEMITIDSLKTLLSNLGFGSGTLKLYSGSVPLEFIREGKVLLAVQTDGGFAPGVRETLMIVARELNRLG